MEDEIVPPSSWACLSQVTSRRTRLIHDRERLVVKGERKVEQRGLWPICSPQLIRP